MSSVDVPKICTKHFIFVLLKIVCGVLWYASCVCRVGKEKKQSMIQAPSKAVLSTSVSHLKRTLRKQLRSALSQVSLPDLQQEGRDLLQRFTARRFLDLQSSFTHICVFLPMRDAREIDMVPLLHKSLERGLRCYVPVVLSDDMEMVRVESLQDFETFEKTGKYEILEPPRDTIDSRENCKR